MRLATLVLMGLLAGCGDDGNNDTPTTPEADAQDDAQDDAPDTGDTGSDTADTAPEEDVEIDTPEPDVPERLCEPSAAGVLPDDLVTITYDDDQGQATVADQDWVIAEAPLATSVLHEQVRFDLEHPARIHGFSVQYGRVPDADVALRAGLYPDFGHNGFDMWHFDPVWEGSLCAADVEPGEWVTFVLDEPVEVSHPGPLYVGHKRSDGGPAWLFDTSLPGEECESLSDCCNVFTNCHSSWNLPELVNFTINGQANYSYPGLSLSVGYDYLVRLHVEYTDDVTPEEKIFQPVADVPLGSRTSFADYDGDGDDDILTNGPKLWQNDGTGTFTDVTVASGIAALEVRGGGGVWGDFDNDGCLDLYLFVESGTHRDSLLRSRCDGTFEDVTESSGVSDLQDYNGCAAEWTHTPSPAAAWFDFDADGLLDLYVGGFICWDAGTYFTDKVWHNQGDGVFTEATGMFGFRDYSARRLATRGASPIDFDLDGDVDLLASNYRLHPNLFYRNNDNVSMSDAGETHNLDGSPTVYGGATYFGHTIGVAWGDLNNDGRFDLIESNLAHPRFFDFSDKTRVLLYQLGGQYVDVQGDWLTPESDSGLRYQETHSVPVLGDFNQDGNLDLAISAVYDGRPTDFYWGRGDGTFELDAYRAGIDVTNGWGMAVSDIDGDGDLDLAAKGVLYRNTLADKGAWLQVVVDGNDGANRAALGTTVRVHANGQAYIRHVGGGSGQGNQNSQTLHFGLGEASVVDRIEARFPGGDWIAYEGPFDTGRRMTVRQDGSSE